MDVKMVASSMETGKMISRRRPKGSSSLAEYEALSFPLKLHVMLQDADELDFTAIVSWQSNGKCFRVHAPDKFAFETMRVYFKQTKYKSFQRQLNIYGFGRITYGPNKGSYSHQSFVRGCTELSSSIVRKSNNRPPQHRQDDQDESGKKKNYTTLKMNHQQEKEHQHRSHQPLLPAPHKDVATMVGVSPDSFFDPNNMSYHNRMDSCSSNYYYDAGGGGGNSTIDAPATQPWTLLSVADLPSSFTAADGGVGSGGFDEVSMTTSLLLDRAGEFNLEDPLLANLEFDFRSKNGEWMKFTDAVLLDDPASSNLPRSTAERPEQQQKSHQQQEVAPPVSTGNRRVHASSILVSHDDNTGAGEQSSSRRWDNDDEHDCSEVGDHAAGSNGQQTPIFPWKLHQMLEDATKKEGVGGFEDIISWVSNGQSFKVHNHARFLSEVMPNYFDQTKYESFRRQLNLYGFIRTTRGPYRGTYSHPLFCQADRRLCQQITRKSQGSAVGTNGSGSGRSSSSSSVPPTKTSSSSSPHTSRRTNQPSLSLSSSSSQHDHQGHDSSRRFSGGGVGEFSPNNNNNNKRDFLPPRRGGGASPFDTPCRMLAI